MTREDFEAATQEIADAWSAAQTRDDGLRVIVELGQKYGFKNVIAAIQGRVPKRFTREKPISEWIDERHREEKEA
ncbi:MAG: hypothetical protein ACR2JC_02485 [Chloroflexota bacterium]